MSFYNVARAPNTQSQSPSPSPSLRHGPAPSNKSSTYSSLSGPYLPSRTGTVSSATSSTSFQPRRVSGQKRGLSETADATPDSISMGRSSVENSPDRFYRNVRQSLRPLPQAPVPSSSSSTTTVKQRTTNHARSTTLDTFPQTHSEDVAPEPMLRQSLRASEPRSPSEDIQSRHASPHSSAFVAPDLQDLKKSSTSHLRTLSKIAQGDDAKDFSLSSPTSSVVGLHNRRQLKRTDSARNGGRGKYRPLEFGERNWMDKQRQFLQAYEYLCHIGEAKEWIEDIIHQPIPPIVELEEALRNGVTLAEIVQAFHPGQRLRVFRHERLQFKHSDNISLFFRFLEEVGLPDLFRFELIDLYEKKNIPKVIYCIHALSWLLYRKGMVDFRIGNLVGQLQFHDHELEQTQKGLDRAGVSMPSFHGMGASFGAEPEPQPEPEPEPEPVETEEDRIARELGEHEAMVLDFQSQVRGAVQRMQLGGVMQELWDAEGTITALQSRIRGDWARQVCSYRLDMKRFATNLQAAARGYAARSKQVNNAQTVKASETQILQLQSLFRASRARKDVRALRVQAQKHQEGVRTFQALVRGALARRDAMDQVEATQRSEREVKYLQGAIRGMALRKRLNSQLTLLHEHTPAVTSLQASVRGFLSRIEDERIQRALNIQSGQWIALQSAVRAMETRRQMATLKAALRSQSSSVVEIQALIRGRRARQVFKLTNEALARETTPLIQLQASVRGVLARRLLSRQHQQLLRHTSQLVKLQSLARAVLARNSVGRLLSELQDAEYEVVQLQAFARAVLCRRNVGNLLGDLDDHEDVVVELQAAIRGRAVRSRFEEKKRFFKTNMEKVVKIQSIVRAKIQGQAYKSLTSGDNPPVGTLKGFVHLLNDNDFDFDEEIEFERLRKTVVQHVRQNELADQYIQQLDIKIALLVKNKITLDEVVKHQKHFGHIGMLSPMADLGSKESDLKALNKTSRRKLEHYQELFFLLQTQPQYLSRLFLDIREQATAEKECEKIKHLVMGLFGYAQKRREEYYLLKLIVRSIREEVDHSESLQEYVRTNAFFNRLIAAHMRSPKDRTFLRNLLGPIVKQNFIDNATLNLESDPLQIYQSAINNEELRTGQRSRRDPNVPREEAIRDPETRATFIAHLQDLRDITDQVFLSLEDCLSRMPFGIRSITQQAYDLLLARFPREDGAWVLQLVGQWIWRVYLLPALVDPEKLGVADRAMTQEQKKNLSEVAKVLNQAVSGREFGGDNVYLQPLNNYIKEAIDRFSSLWRHVIAVPSAEEHYDIDEFNDLYAKTKPTLYVKMADIFSIHQLVASEAARICPSQDDGLREVLRELGSVKSNEAELMGVSSGEIMLTLTPKYLNTEDPDADIKALFTETKRCVLYIIRVQAGKSLLDILVQPVSEEDEDKWDGLVREELRGGAGKRGAYSEMTNTLDFTTLSYPDLKRVALENVLQLESVGRLTRANRYQDMLNAIAVDIRTKHRRRLQRQRELEGVKTTLQRLNEQAVYLEQQLKTYNDYIEQAMVTLQNKKGKKRFLLPFTKQWEHERELQRAGRSFKFGSYKYSARTLADKGVLVHWRGYTEQQWYRVDITISSNEVGVFTIDGSSGNMMIPGASAQVPLDDLLQAQFNNTQVMEFFDGRALRVNVNLFLHLIMKKFYNE